MLSPTAVRVHVRDNWVSIENKNPFCGKSALGVEERQWKAGTSTLPKEKWESSKQQQRDYEKCQHPEAEAVSTMKVTSVQCERFPGGQRSPIFTPRFVSAKRAKRRDRATILSA